MMMGGSVPAVVLGDQAPLLVTTAGDIGFYGALVTTLGGDPMGIGGLSHALLPRPSAVTLMVALPLGMLGLVLLSTVGAPEDVIGLPLTLLHGLAWVLLGAHWAREGREAPATVAP